MTQTNYENLLALADGKLGTSRTPRSLRSEQDEMVYEGVMWKATKAQPALSQGQSFPWVSRRVLFLGRTTDSRNVHVNYGLQEALSGPGVSFYSESFGVYGSENGSVAVLGMLKGFGVSAEFNRAKTVLNVFPELVDLSSEVVTEMVGGRLVPVGVVGFVYDGFRPEQLEDVVGRVADRYKSREEKPFEFSSPFW